METKTQGSWEAPHTQRYKNHIKKKVGDLVPRFPAFITPSPCGTLASAPWWALTLYEQPDPTSVWPISANTPLVIVRLCQRAAALSADERCSCGETLTDGVNYYSSRRYSWLDGVQANLLSYHVCETRPVSRIGPEPIRQKQYHATEIEPLWKSWSWETSPECLSDAGNYSSANTPADLYYCTT